MKKRIIAIIAIVLAVLLALGSGFFIFKSCQKDKKPGNKPNSEVEPSEISEGLIEEEEDDIFDEELLPEGLEDYESFYVPESYYTTYSELPEFDMEDEDFDDIVDDDEEEVDIIYSRIQVSGKKVSGSKRVFNVDCSDVVYKDFRGIGSCTFPSNMIPDALANANNTYDELSLELDRKRFISTAPHFSRMWFQVDHIITSEETDPTRDDIENNKDYQNYTNGIYDFDSPDMQAIYPVLEAYQASGMHIGMNFGWKIHQRVQSWWSFPGITSPGESAPYDLDAYAKACAETMYELRENRGYTCMDDLTFFNEPGNTYDFLAFVDTKEYFCIMLNKVEQALIDKGIRDDIDIWACEQNSIYFTWTAFTDYVYENARQYYDITTPHYYYGTSNQVDDYATLYEMGCFMNTKYPERPIYLTEYYAGTYGNNAGQYGSADGIGERGLWKDWNDSEASYLIAVANTGIEGYLNWGYTGGWLPKPNNFDPAGGMQAAWYSTRRDGIKKNVNHNYYEIALIGNYIPEDSDVLMIDWEGDDVRGAAFKTPDGGYSILIESNGYADEAHPDNRITGTNRELTINLNNISNKNLKFNKFVFSPDKQDVDAHGTVNSPEKYGMSLTNGAIKDKLPKNYCWVLYTTLDPIKQVEIDASDWEYDVTMEYGTTDTVENPVQISNEKSNGTIDLDAALIDCDSSDSLVWSISNTTYASDKTAFSINENTGVISIDTSKVSVGDRIGVRATLASDPLVYDFVIIEIVNDTVAS